jgi:hypothetical protein
MSRRVADMATPQLPRPLQPPSLLHHPPAASIDEWGASPYLNGQGLTPSRVTSPGKYLYLPQLASPTLERDLLPASAATVRVSRVASSSASISATASDGIDVNDRTTIPRDELLTLASASVCGFAFRSLSRTEHAKEFLRALALAPFISVHLVFKPIPVISSKKHMQSCRNGKSVSSTAVADIAAIASKSWAKFVSHTCLYPIEKVLLRLSKKCLHSYIYTYISIMDETFLFTYLTKI